MRWISGSSADMSSLPFHSPFTLPATLGAKILKCLPVGRPSTGVALGSVKVRCSVSCEMYSFFVSVSCCLSLFRNFFGALRARSAASSSTARPTTAAATIICDDR